jgi:hypothetical protein
MTMICEAVKALLVCGAVGAFTVNTDYRQHAAKVNRAGSPPTTAFLVSNPYKSAAYEHAYYDVSTKDLDISDVLAESEAALAAANQASQTTPTTVPVTRSNQEEQEIVASGVGGASWGLVLGGAALMQHTHLALTMEPSMVLPLFAAACGAASVSLSSMEGVGGQIARAVLGTPTRNMGLMMKQALNDAIDSMVSKAQHEREHAKDQIIALPSLMVRRIQDIGKALADASAKKIEETVQESISLPSKLAKAISLKFKETTWRVAENIKATTPSRIKEATWHVAKDIQATPNKIAEKATTTFRINEQEVHPKVPSEMKIEVAPGRLIFQQLMEMAGTMSFHTNTNNEPISVEEKLDDVTVADRTRATSSKPSSRSFFSQMSFLGRKKKNTIPVPPRTPPPINLL